MKYAVVVYTGIGMLLSGAAYVHQIIGPNGKALVVVKCKVNSQECYRQAGKSAAGHIKWSIAKATRAGCSLKFFPAQSLGIPWCFNAFDIGSDSIRGRADCYPMPFKIHWMFRGMNMKFFAAVVFIVGITISPLAMAAPSAQCALNADKSSVSVMVSNPDSGSWTCIASCRVYVEGQKAIEPMKCNYSVRPNASNKAECQRDSGEAKHYSHLGPTSMTCQPRK